MGKKIFVIKQARITNEKKNTLESVGFFFEKKEALKRIEKNALDLSDDGYYNYCCLMSFEEGLYSIFNEELWYKWDKEVEKYIKCDKPKQFDNIAFFI